jgi:hypothetical protein
MARRSGLAVKLFFERGLPFATVTLSVGGGSVELERVLIDTGSAGCVFSADHLLDIGVAPEVGDRLRRIRGVGGAEFVFTRRVRSLRVAELEVTDFEVEVGAMDYGFDLRGIIGTDFLLATQAIIDLAAGEIRTAM